MAVYNTFEKKQLRSKEDFIYAAIYLEQIDQ